MKFIQFLNEAPLPSQYEAGMKRYGIEEVGAKIDQAAANSPEAVIELVRHLAKQGYVDQDTLAELAKVKDVIDRLMLAAKSGKVDVQKPEAGSFYAKQKERMEQPSAEQQAFDTIKRRTAYAVKQNNPALIKQMNILLTKEFMRRRGGA